MTYLHRLIIFIMIIIFSVSASFSQDWRKLTTQEFKNVIGKKIKNKECNFKFEKGVLQEVRAHQLNMELQRF